MRLTRFNNLTKEYEYHLNNPNTSIIQDEIAGIQKLGQLEDIEEELGIDLVTLFKALKNGITNYNGKSKWYVALAYNQIRDEYYLYCDFGGGYSKTRDYDIECGWALTKEELL